MDSHGVTRTVHYSGHVQGVGFRYTSSRIARRFEVAGFVKNLPDGRVLLVAEGDAAEVTRFLTAVNDQLQANIRHADIVEAPAAGEFTHFEIR
ncbi:acylphosphatase [Lignipirellula cremea]|uniref:acylphosphatase n=1 Tax=Lignipirellula cremea TaxID=2528010 RepID=A0A518DR54_9BACT|nr:acylphosphatase [Lignipirellula cremea]QDU94321.1 Acylphosphatase [Lignipirellula cremea]